MAAKRKYTKIGETPLRYQCSNKKCKWQGKMEEKSEKRIDDFTTEYFCPKCGNNEFYGLLV
ncbi:hypothetical protein AD998_21930 [bacterium 336/3]|nr:hypothetical protein AD998_21930 [bacterium 336/3]